jgi:FOG: TPR repeat, SEL1 subfamily
LRIASSCGQRREHGVTPAQEAMALAQSGRAQDGLLVLRAAQAMRNADAFLLEGLWLLEGRFVERDETAARAHIARAAELGNAGAARTLAALTACGIGGPPDWMEALSVLDRSSGADPLSRHQLDLISCMAIDQKGCPTVHFARRAVSTDPRLERVDGLLTAEECAFLVKLADPRMKRAAVFHDGEQRFVEDPVRRSHNAGFSVVSEWPFVRAINLRIAAATGTDVERGEPLQALRYGPSDEYRPHCDAIAGMANPRILTALIWLTEDYSGGETCFDELGIRERGRTGDLLLFGNTLPDGSPDPRTRHSGAPVTSGVKYMASRWIRSRPSGPEGFGRHEIERS